MLEWESTAKESLRASTLPDVIKSNSFYFMRTYLSMTNQSELPRDFLLVFLAQDKILITMKRTGAVSKECDFIS